ncbi:histidine kinase [Aequorivita antarctica]|uniref:Histidine kinase n=1 Tax=Aequorivita antarctica TaxID=153266 RepID=A0A5C6YWQ7_9FLAO|nr:histidine kinase [Aequorivita antarctica]TXD72064.1 histidine kinase [Aequorivita antarctica]
MKNSLLIIFCFLAGVWQISAQIVSDSIIGNVHLFNNPEVYAIRTNLETTFEEVQKESVWKKYDSLFENEPGSAIWLKFDVENTSKELLEAYYLSAHDYTDIYQFIDSDVKMFKNGSLVPLYNRTNKNEFYFTELKIPSFEKSLFYVRLSSIKKKKDFSHTMLYSKEEYLLQTYIQSKYEAKPVAFIFFYIVSLLTVFVFGLVFWMRLRQKLYLYYLGYLFFQIIYAFTVVRTSSATVGNFFLNFPIIATKFTESSQFLFIGFYIFFILNLLEIKKYDQRLSKILIYFGRFCFLYAIAIFIYNIFWEYLTVGDFIFSTVRFIVLPLNFVLIFWIVYKVKHPLLKYFIVGQTFFFIGAILAFYLAYSFNPTHPESIFSFPYSSNIVFQVGLLAEVFCFSIAIGENIFLLQKEKETASQNLIEQLKKNQLMQENMRIELDKKINEKTEELIQLYSKIEKQKEEQIKNSFTQKLQEMEMLALRSQMNPHFLFNSLNSIKHLIMTSRNDDAVKYLDDFSTLLRGILQNSNREIITVEEELEILELYLSLEKNRMGNNFNYSIQVSSREELSQFQIPPLLLQPFVENAIWHGLNTSNNPEKNLTITFDTSECLKITIEDNGIGRKASSEKKKLHKSIGMSITQERLSLYNHSNDTSISLAIIDLEAENIALGTRVTLTYSY